MHAHTGDSGAALAILLVPFALALTAYGVGVAIQRSRGGRWPWYRTVAFTAGIAAAAAGMALPLSEIVAGGFTSHTAGHVLAGMLAPLLLVVSAPVTLALRSLHVSRARRLSRLLRTRAARVFAHPVSAGVLSVGGMWVLYTTPLYSASQASPFVHVMVMAHMIAAGSLFTASLISPDPAPHRAGYPLRISVLLVALAAHGVLAKTLYAQGLAGMPLPDVRDGAMLMYYAGDLVDAALAVILCARWYREAGRRRLRAAARFA